MKDHIMPYNVKINDINYSGNKTIFLDSNGNVYVMGYANFKDDYIKFSELGKIFWTGNYFPMHVTSQCKSLINWSYCIDLNGKVKSFFEDDTNSNYQNSIFFYNSRNGDKSYFINENNELYGKGKNEFGELGLGHKFEVTEYTKIMNHVKKIEVGYKRNFIVDVNNELYVIGEFDGEKLYPTKIMSNVKQVETNGELTAVVTLNHELYLIGQMDVKEGTNKFQLSSYIPYKYADEVVQAGIGYTEDREEFLVYATEHGKVIYTGETLLKTNIKEGYIDYVMMEGQIKKIVVNTELIFILTEEGRVYASGIDEGGYNYMLNAEGRFDIDQVVKIWDPNWNVNSHKFEYYKK